MTDSYESNDELLDLLNSIN